MAALPRPGVQVLQVLESTSPTILTPTFLPCIVGAGFEILERFNSDGTTFNPSALVATPYRQAQLAIPQASFPNSRGNIAQLDVLEAEVSAYLSVSGVLKEALRTEGFLTKLGDTQVARAGIESGNHGADLALAVVGLTLVLGIDTAAGTTPTTVTFAAPAAGGNPTVTQIATQINADVGATVATLATGGGEFRLRIESLAWGAQSSVEIAGAASTARAVLRLPTGSALVDGAGLFAADDNNNNLTSSFVDYQQGHIAAMDGGASGSRGVHFTLDGLTDARANNTNVVVGVGMQPDINFTTLNLAVGDEMWAEGSVVGTSILAVAPTRLTMGVLDATGALLPKELNILTAASPFSPRRVWFQAKNLTGALPAGSLAATTASDAFAAAAGPTVTGAAAVVTDSTPGGADNLGTFEATAVPKSITVALTRGGVNMGSLTRTLSADILIVPDNDANVATNCTLVAAQLNLLDWDFDGAAGANDILFGNAAGALTVITNPVATGTDEIITVLGATHANFSFGASEDVPVVGINPQLAGVSGDTLAYTLDGGATTYTVVLPSNDIHEIIAAINAVTPGIAVLDPGGLIINLTSAVIGRSSQINVTTNPIPGAGVMWNTATAIGTGRPRADFTIVGGSNDASIIGQFVRDKQSGDPAPVPAGGFSVYLEYRALRIDLSRNATTPGLLRLQGSSDLITAVGPVAVLNPLAVGAFQAVLNSPGVEVAILGVEAIDANADGTLIAYTNAFEFLEGYDVYAIAPLSSDDNVHQSLKTHVGLMSKAANRGERIGLIAPTFPDRAASNLIGSGTLGNSTAIANQFTVESAVSDTISDLGLDPLILTVANDVYLEITVAGAVRNYNISAVGGTIITLNTTFLVTENLDAFYTAVAFADAVSDGDWVIRRRGAAITTNADIVTAAAAQGVAMADRRMFMAFGDQVSINIESVEQLSPMYYYMAAVAGLVGAQPPQQGFTNYPMAGFASISGTNAQFTESQMDNIAGGGRWVPIQEVSGGPLVSRHQLSTDISSVESREMSITRVLDYTAKLQRIGLRKFIGTRNITQPMIDQLTTMLFAQIQFLIESGVLIGASIDRLVQDPTQPDRIIVEETVTVPYPANYIKLTLLV